MAVLEKTCAQRRYHEAYQCLPLLRVKNLSLSLSLSLCLSLRAEVERWTETESLDLIQQAHASSIPP